MSRVGEAQSLDLEFNGQEVYLTHEDGTRIVVRMEQVGYYRQAVIYVDDHMMGSTI